MPSWALCDALVRSEKAGVLETTPLFTLSASNNEMVLDWSAWFFVLEASIEKSEGGLGCT